MFYTGEKKYSEALTLISRNIDELQSNKLEAHFFYLEMKNHESYASTLFWEQQPLDTQRWRQVLKTHLYYENHIIQALLDCETNRSADIENLLQFFNKSKACKVYPGNSYIFDALDSTIEKIPTYAIAKHPIGPGSRLKKTLINIRTELSNIITPKDFVDKFLEQNKNGVNIAMQNKKKSARKLAQ